MARRKEEISETLVNLDEISDSVTSYYDKYKNIILGVGGGLLVLFVGYYAYKNFYIAPKQKEAVKQMTRAEQLFSKDSFDLALNNPGGGLPGFKDIASKYSGTNAGNLANYYAGVCLVQTGKAAEAINYLEKFDPEGNTLPIMKSSLLGDAYADQNNLDKALSYYQKAASSSNNEAITPFVLMKLGMLAEKMGKNEDAKKAYQRIKDEYATTSFGRNIDKYLYRVTE